MSLMRTWTHGGGLLSFVGLIPFLGALVHLVWGIVMAVVVVEEIHQLTRGKAVAVVLIPVALLALCACIAFFTVGMTLFGLMNAAQNQ
jgi:hypothetical protein